MQCPECSSVMIQKPTNGIAVNHCKSCDGIWCNEKDTLNFVNSLHNLFEKGVKFKSVPTDELNFYRTVTPGLCPHCNNMLNKFTWGGTNVISLRCDNNCGSFLKMDHLGNLLTHYSIFKDTINYPITTQKKENNFFETSDSFGKGLFGLMEDSVQIRNTPVVNYILIALNVIIFLYSLTWNKIIFSKMMFTPQAFINDPIANIHSFFSSMFMHGGLQHIIGNMYFLYVFGDNIEDRLGKAKYIAFYLFCGFIATFSHLVFTSEPDIPLLGASGAISGVLGGYLYLFPKAKISFYNIFFFQAYKINVPVWVYIGIWFLGQQFLGIAMHLGNTAWFAHLGGFVAGLLIMLILKITDSF